MPPPRSHSLDKQKYEKQQETIDASPMQPLSNTNPSEKSAKNEILILGEKFVFAQQS